MPNLVYSVISPIGPFDFGGGLNLQATPDNIKNNQTPDSCNCVSGLDGSMSKIFGTKRYIEQSRSSQPVTSLYRTYAATGTTKLDVLLAVIGTDIVVSTSRINPVWTILSSGVVPGQNWSFVTMNNRVILAGDGLVNPIYQYDIFRSSLSDLFAGSAGTDSVRFTAKYLLMKDNYLLFANIRDLTQGSTYYPSRVMYSFLNNQSSVSYSRYFDVRTNDGEEITGMGINFDLVNIFKPSSIHDLSFTTLNLISLGGDQVLSEIVNGFGLKAPRSLQSDGIYYFFGAQDGYRIWDGGRRSRLNVTEESRVISGDIKTLIDRLINAGTYKNIVSKYYKKREWIVLSYEDPERFPENVNNSVIIYDIRLGQWYPICGWLASSFTSFDGEGDNGELLYGDSNDGAVLYADIETSQDNSPRNLVLDTMDSSFTWRGIQGTNLTKNFNDITEGTGSLRMWINETVTESSMTRMASFPMGQWLDKTNVIRDDKFSFKMFTPSTNNITSLRVDLLVNDEPRNDFDNNFSSYTFSNFSAFRSSGWNTLEVKLSSFGVRSDWTALEGELIPFGGTLNFYGMRFVLLGVGGSTVTIDDVRIVQSYNPVNFYRFTKMFNFDSMAFKTAGQILLTMDKPSDSSLLMDIYNDFGKKTNTIKYEADIPKEIIVMGWTSTASITVLDDTDFSIKRTTDFAESDYLPLNGVSTKDSVFFSDRTNNRIVKLDRGNFGVIQSTYGEFGSGTTNFNLVIQMDANEKGSLFMNDTNNQRIKEHLQGDLSFRNSVGTLGGFATSYIQPNALSATDEKVTITDEGNYNIQTLNISTFGITLRKEIDFNIIADSTLEEDAEFFYLAYNKISDLSNLFQDVLLEKRFKGDATVVTRVRVTPKDIVSLSTYAIQGDIALRGRYIYISFTNTAIGEGQSYYLQKRLKKDFSLVSEVVAPREIFSVMGDAFAYKPSLKNEKKDLEAGEGKYLQIKFYDEGKDNYVRLINQTFLVEGQPQKY